MTQKPDYPSDERMAQLFEAWKKGGKRALEDALRKPLDEAAAEAPETPSAEWPPE